MGKNLALECTVGLDIIDENNEFKVCEFSYCFEHEFLENSFYYDIKEEKILKMKNKLKDNAFYTQKELLKTIGALNGYKDKSCKRKNYTR